MGAAVRTGSGSIYVGANMENASYGLSICAEVSALTAANTSGERDVAEVAVVGGPMADPTSSWGIITPCGRCRQLIWEASQVSKVDVLVVSSTGDLKTIARYGISELLPEAFGPASMVTIKTEMPERT